MAETTTSIQKLLGQHRSEILRLAQRHGANRVRIFGSTARGEAHGASDLDLLVEMEEGRSLLDRIALQQDLQDLLGFDVDVVTEKALHPLLRSYVLKEAIDL